MSVIEALKSKEGFTSTERGVADYILHNAEIIARMSIAELSKATFTSNASIVRLCRKVGLNGYRDLRIALATELERRRGALSDIDVNNPFSDKESTATIMRSIAKLTAEATEACYGTISPETIDAIARAALNAQSVLLYGVGDSCVSSEMFAELVSKLGIHCINAYHNGDTLPHAYMAREGDVALFISYSGIILPNLQIDLSALRNRGCKTAVITAREEHDPLVRDFDYKVIFPSREALYGKIATFYSQTCIRYVLNCIYGRMYTLDFETNRSQKDEIDMQLLPFEM